MDTVIITGCAGLIGSECVKKFHSLGYEIVGIDNYSRGKYFGEKGNSARTIDEFFNMKRFNFYSADISNHSAVDEIFKQYSGRTVLVIHTASLPAHTTCDENPFLAYSVNVSGTVNILEGIKTYCHCANFIFCSSSKVYGNRHSKEEGLKKVEKRFDFKKRHPLYGGIPEEWNPDADDRSILGSTKLAADVMCQQYSQTYGITTSIWRPGCLSGENHAGTTQHGFLSYLTRCALERKKYTIFGYGGYQTRDNWHSSDMINAFDMWFRKPKRELSIYNIGGSRFSNCSVLEAIDIIQEYIGNKMNIEINNTPRKADHKFFIGSSKRFLSDYPEYKWKYNSEDIIHRLCDSWKEKLNG